jgi:hypothetical protein
MNMILRFNAPTATTAECKRSILACLAIVVWHFYGVILDPDI